MHHPLHLAVSEELQGRLDGRGELLKDPACGGAQHLPLFVGTLKRRDTRMCNVDLLIVLPLKESRITDYRLFFVKGVGDGAGLESVGATVSEALS